MNHEPTRTSRLRALALGGLGLGLLALGLLAWARLPQYFPPSTEQTPVVPAQVAFPPPTLNLYDLHGNPVSLADFSGQVVLVNNWATWCPPCRAEMPALQAFFEAHQSQGFMVVAIEAGDDPANVARFVDEYGLTFSVWADPEEQALAAFQNIALPNSYIIDRSGLIRLAWNGPITLGQLEQTVTPLLEN